MKGLIDIHSHMLPGVDDGADNMKESVEMLRQAFINGTRTIILTPHYYGGRYVTSKETILEVYIKFKEIAKKASEKLNIYIGNELYYQEDIVERLDKEEVYTMADSSYVLIEFAPSVLYEDIRKGLNALIFGGYVPILAHVERYECLVKDIGLVEKLVELGTYMQVNASTITASGNVKIKRFVRQLIKKECLHIVASDAHNATYRAPGMKEVYLYLAKKYSTELANDLLIKNPERIIRNEYI